MGRSMLQIGMTPDAIINWWLSAEQLCHDQLASWEGVALLEQLPE